MEVERENYGLKLKQNSLGKGYGKVSYLQKGAAQRIEDQKEVNLRFSNQDLEKRYQATKEIEVFEGEANKDFSFRKVRDD